MAKEYLTWEAIKLLTENPELEFTNIDTDNHVVMKIGEMQRLITISDKPCFNVLIFLDSHWVIKLPSSK